MAAISSDTDEIGRWFPLFRSVCACRGAAADDGFFAQEVRRAHFRPWKPERAGAEVVDVPGADETGGLDTGTVPGADRPGVGIPGWPVEGDARRAGGGDEEGGG